MAGNDGDLLKQATQKMMARYEGEIHVSLRIYIPQTPRAQLHMICSLDYLHTFGGMGGSWTLVLFAAWKQLFVLGVALLFLLQISRSFTLYFFRSPHARTHMLFIIYWLPCGSIVQVTRGPGKAVRRAYREATIGDWRLPSHPIFPFPRYIHVLYVQGKCEMDNGDEFLDPVGQFSNLFLLSVPERLHILFSPLHPLGVNQSKTFLLSIFLITQSCLSPFMIITK